MPKPYFSPRVPDPAYRPAAGTVPTVDTAVAVRAGSGPGGARLFIKPSEPVRPGAAVPAHGNVAVPGSTPSVIQDIVTSPVRSHVATGFSAQKHHDPLARVIVEPSRFKPVQPRVVAVSADTVAAELESTHYPRAPIRRHKRKKRGFP